MPLLFLISPILFYFSSFLFPISLLPARENKHNTRAFPLSLFSLSFISQNLEQRGEPQKQLLNPLFFIISSMKIQVNHICHRPRLLLLHLLFILVSYMCVFEGGLRSGEGNLKGVRVEEESKDQSVVLYPWSV